jgi:hypothetical protein
MLFQLNVVVAALFGLGSPLLVVALSSLRWWLVWFLLGIVLFAWPVGAMFTARDDGSLGYAVGLGLVTLLVLPGAALFLLSFLARGYWLATRRAGPPAVS